MLISNYTKKRALKIFLLIFLITSVILGIVKCCKSMPDKKLLSTKTYDIYELTLDDTRIYFSYIDEQKRINKDYYPEYDIMDIIYLNENNKVTIEYWGYDKDITDVKLIKFYVDEQTYKELSKKYEWETEYNMDYY